MIHTLTLNPSLDYIAECPHFTLSATNRTTGETIYPGGKGINVSLVLKNLGYSSITHGFIAGFTGQALVSLLEQTGLQTDMISVSEGLTRGKTRLEAVRRMRRALEELIIDGVPTNYEFMHLLTYHPSFLKGNYNTGFWEENHKTIEKWLEEGMGDNDH